MSPISRRLASGSSIHLSDLPNARETYLRIADVRKFWLRASGAFLELRVCDWPATRGPGDARIDFRAPLGLVADRKRVAPTQRRICARTARTPFRFAQRLRVGRQEWPDAEKVRVKATIGGKSFWQLREINTGDGWSNPPLEAHFGLGDATAIQTLRIEWPSGIVQELQNVPAKEFLTVTEPPRLLTAVTGDHALFSLKGGRGFQYDIELPKDLVAWPLLGTLTITKWAALLNRLFVPHFSVSRRQLLPFRIVLRPKASFGR